MDIDPYESAERDNLRLAFKQMKFSLNLYNFSASLCYETLQYLSTQTSEKEPFEIEKCVAYMLLTRTTGLMQSIKALVLRGYYCEALILERSFWEALGLCSYLTLNRKEAEKWYDGERIDLSLTMRPECILKVLELNTKPSSFENIYRWLCNFVHSNSPAILGSSSFFDCPDENTKRITVAIPSRFERKIVQGLASYPTIVLLIMTRIFDKELPDEHKKKLEKAMISLTKEHQ